MDNFRQNPELENKLKPSALDKHAAEQAKLFKEQNPVEQFRKKPGLENQLQESELDKYAAEQKQKFKEDNPVHEYQNKKNKKLQGRQKLNEDKLNRRAKQHAAVEKHYKKDKLLNQLDHDKKVAQLDQKIAAKTHGQTQREQYQDQLRKRA